MPVSVCESSMSLALRDCLSSTSTKSDDMQLKNQLVSSAKRVLLSKIDYEEVNNYTTTVLDSLKSKYIVLKAANFTKSTLYDDKDKNSSRMNGNSTNHGTKDEQLGNPKRILFPRDNIQIGWNSSSRKWQIGSGMTNVGNTCYLNSILQALFHVPALANWLISDSQHREICEDLGGGQGGCIICAMSKTLITSQNSQMPIKPLLVYSKLRLVCKHLVPGRQEDAHEFLRYLVEAMEKAYLHRFKNSKDLDQYSKETTPLNQILGGYLRSTVRCLACGHVSTTFQHFEDLLLDIRKANSIEEALDGYFARERLEDMGYKCESCKKKVSATKQFSLERAPIVLCMQLKRFSMMGNKINKHVVIRPKLDLSPHASTKTLDKLTYKLVAMVTHLGASQNCGHYTAIGLTEVGGYYHFDDSCVRPISIQNALNTNAYILFFELDNVKTNQQMKTIVNDSACKLMKKNSEENLSWKMTTTATEVKSKDEDVSNTSWIFGNNKNHVSKSVFDNLSNSVDEKTRNTTIKSNQDILGTPSLSSPSTSTQSEVKLNAVRETMTQPSSTSLLPKENGSKTLPISEIRTIYKNNEDNSKFVNIKSPIITTNTTSKLVINENGYKVLSTLSPKMRENFFDTKKTSENNTSNENSHNNKNIIILNKKKDYTLTPQIKSPIKLPSLPILTNEEKTKTENNCNNNSKSNGQVYSLVNSHTNGKHNNFTNHNNTNGNDNSKLVNNNNNKQTNNNNNEAKVIIPRSLVPYETDDESDNYNDDEINIVNNKAKNTTNNNNNTMNSMDVDEAPVVKTKAGFWQVTEIPVQNPSLQGKTSNMKCTEIIATKQKKHKIENDTINHLLKYSHRGYGAPVVSWNEKKTNLEKEVNEEKRSEKTRDQEDQDDDSEFDRGRTKKIKLQNGGGGGGNNNARDNPGFNPFQEAQNQQNRRWNNNNSSSSSSSSSNNNGGRFYNNHIYRQNPHHHNHHSNNRNNFRSRFKNGYNSFHHQRNDSNYRRRD